MGERIDNRLLFQDSQGLQTRVSFLEAMLGEIRDGFAAIRSLRSNVKDEVIKLEHRVNRREKSMERVEHCVRLCEPGEPP